MAQRDIGVTVLMSVYNGERYVAEAVESILRQTCRDFEFLIVNDCSTDATAEILRGFDDSRIRIMENTENMGLTRSLNRGAARARGEFVARMDADDVSEPGRLEKQVAFLRSHPGYAAAGSFARVIDASSDLVRLWKRPVTDAEIRERLRWGNAFVHGSAMIRKDSLERVGLYDESIARAQDYDLWLRLSERYRLANIPEYLYNWRNHEASICERHYSEQLHFVDVAQRKALGRRLGGIVSSLIDGERSVEQALAAVVKIVSRRVLDRNLRKRKFLPLKLVLKALESISFGAVERTFVIRPCIARLLSGPVGRLMARCRNGDETPDKTARVLTRFLYSNDLW